MCMNMPLYDDLFDLPNLTRSQHLILCLILCLKNNQFVLNVYFCVCEFLSVSNVCSLKGFKPKCVSGRSDWFRPGMGLTRI